MLARTASDGFFILSRIGNLGSGLHNEHASESTLNTAMLLEAAISSVGIMKVSANLLISI